MAHVKPAGTTLNLSEFTTPEQGHFSHGLAVRCVDLHPRQAEGLASRRQIIPTQHYPVGKSQVTPITESDSLPGKTEIPAGKHRHRGILSCQLRQVLRPVCLTKDQRFAGSGNPAFFTGNGFPGLTQPVLVIQPHRGDHRHIRIDDIDRIKSAPEPHLQQYQICPALPEQPQRRQGTELKIGQGNVLARLLNLFKRFTELLIRRQTIRQANALIETMQMGEV